LGLCGVKWVALGFFVCLGWGFWFCFFVGDCFDFVFAVFGDDFCGAFVRFFSRPPLFIGSTTVALLQVSVCVCEVLG
jgi:hypothetical protein